jgi:hypothetical protein
LAPIARTVGDASPPRERVAALFTDWQGSTDDDLE